MDQETWWREIMYHCDDISVLDRDAGRCRYEKPYPEPTFDCNYENCPKRKDRKRDIVDFEAAILKIQGQRRITE